MRLGKLTSDELTKVIISKTSTKNKEIVQSAGLAEDCCAVKTDKTILLTTDPITATGSNAGKLAIYVSANDIAVGGGVPFCCLLTIIAPPETPLDEIGAFMAEASQTAEEMKIDIIGGHTEFSAAVNKTVVVCTMAGTAKKVIKTCGAQAGDSIIFTKTAAVEATAILARDFRDKLLAGGMTPSEIDEAASFIDKVPVAKDAAAALQCAVNSMHDVTEGGVYGAVAELAESANLGATVYADSIPVANVTSKICKILKVSPMRLIGSGSILIVSPEPDKTLNVLKKNGVEATVIGTMRRTSEITAISEGRAEKISALPDELLTVGK